MLTIRKLFVLFALATVWPQTPAQNRAQRQIVLAPFAEGPDKNTRVAFLVVSRIGVTVGKPIVNITTHRLDDDEPAFLPDSTGFLFASNRDGKQSDIFRYDIASKAVTQVTRTPDDEWNPAPSRDGKTFTVARGTLRRLWRFHVDGADAGAVSPAIEGVVTHAWLSDTAATAIASVSAESGSAARREARLLDTATGAAPTVESGIGHSMFIRPDRKSFGFTRRLRDGTVVIREWEEATQKVRETASAVEDAEDVACSPEGRLIMGRRSKMFFFEAESDRWVEFADLDKSKISSIERVAVSPDGKWIAIVSRVTVK